MTDNYLAVQFIIKFSDSSLADLALDIEDVSKVSVSSIRRQIRETVGGKTSNRRLRLIHNGRLLNENINIARDVAKVSVKGKEISNNHISSSNNNNNNSPKRIYIHCSVGDILDANELLRENELDKKAVVKSTGPELRGFDRLRNAGFTDTDINVLRQQFTSMNGGAAAAAAGRSGTGDPIAIPSAVQEEELTRLEEQWINTGVTEDNAANASGNDHLEDLTGLLIGMFLGVMSLLFLKEGGLFTARQRRFILGGVFINFLFALVRMFN
ncbi:hypothetical protein D0Z00_001083 [Geotrichum galactomycetum]|uniref:Uncharacterized protein n=1 Tax=Geotrichum galactomycetum TaxID=27317 RepID=A0ACB6V804_9ASCO|nr:hypothetical protein D0Z00_001083 [Geotrichum candidum]